MSSKSLLPATCPPESPSGQLRLCIPSPSVRLESDQDATTTALSETTLCLLSGSLDDFILFAGQEASQWLLDQAHDICDPTHLRGSLWVWKGAWVLVARTDPLIASTYFYILPTNLTTPLSKISRRDGRSKASSNTRNNARIMRSRVLERDERCWVTKNTEPLTNSHICPKRMGDDLARGVFEAFTGLPHSPNQSILDPTFGLCLTLNLDTWFCSHVLGFRFVSPNTYRCHIFNTDPQCFYTAAGAYRRIPPPPYLLIHGCIASPPNPDRDSIPPPGLLRWHYLQCVIKKFGHSNYTSLAGIQFPNLMEVVDSDEDSDDESGTDDEADWPSKSLDLGRAIEAERVEGQERLELVDEWLLSTS
ncbi:hypothetical protein MIND_01039800 [Mycena indigotica]|uniref:Uncharacterized protein n=1 Tax=Mycena indigotica TaxID=2126181 RepID=A0A8H6SB04_9AGAR|nr:uncharacterized protein MIND_01039800 [Mycena indigotica]KAF7295017.1 hypothetical protein MIND_01039800 [Mycena indigotica]